MRTGGFNFRWPFSFGAVAAPMTAAVVFACAACTVTESKSLAAGALPDQPIQGTDSKLAQTEPPPQLTEQQRRQLQVFGPILLNASVDIDPNTRRNAAQELIEMRVPEATEVLAEALRSRKAPVMLAAVSALYSSKISLPDLDDSAVAALVHAPPDALEPLCWLVSRYGDQALRRVAEMARNPNASPEARLGPIHALGSFRSRTAASHLISILQTPPGSLSQSPTDASKTVRAACQSLERLTGLPHGVEPAKWTQWWSEASQLTDEEWYRLVADSLSRRVAELQTQLLKETQMSQLASRELAETYRELYPALTTDDQLRRLPELLDDQLPAVREFALNRISLLLRDSVRIPAEVQTKLAQRLGDEQPGLRLMAGRLLDELNYEGAAQVLAARLSSEKSPEVVRGFLEILAKRPTIAAVEPLHRLLRDRELHGDASTALWRILPAVQIPASEMAALQESARTAFSQYRTPPLARLLAFVGDATDTADLSALLDQGESAMRAAIAEGFSRRGLRQPLIDRAADPEIYPFAVDAIVQSQPDLGNFRTLVRLIPPETKRQRWLDGIQAMATRLGSANALAIDDMLVNMPEISPRVRRDVLITALDAPREVLGDNRSKLIVRVAPLLLDLNEPGRAHELLESLNGETASPSLQGMRFRAAVLSGQYEIAAKLESKPAAWVALLADIAQRDVIVATALRDEIERRFIGQLADADQALFDQISEQLRRAA